MEIIVRFETELFSAPCSTYLRTLALICKEFREHLEIALAAGGVLGEVLVGNRWSRLRSDGLEVIPINGHD